MKERAYEALLHDLVPLMSVRQIKQFQVIRDGVYIGDCFHCGSTLIQSDDGLVSTSKNDCYCNGRLK